MSPRYISLRPLTNEVHHPRVQDLNNYPPKHSTSLASVNTSGSSTSDINSSAAKWNGNSICWAKCHLSRVSTASSYQLRVMSACTSFVVFFKVDLGDLYV